MRGARSSRRTRTPSNAAADPRAAQKRLRTCARAVTTFSVKPSVRRGVPSSPAAWRSLFIGQPWWSAAGSVAHGVAPRAADALFDLKGEKTRSVALLAKKILARSWRPWKNASAVETHQSSQRRSRPRGENRIPPCARDPNQQKTSCCRRGRGSSTRGPRRSCTGTRSRGSIRRARFGREARC
jgi:hypothetical protein